MQMIGTRSATSGHAGKYFPHVDGLRAVAVVMVLCFHYGFSFPGGYAGVDVFFVVSGFLITGLLMRDLDTGTFRAADFWCRRARRILPALLLVLAATAIAGWFVMLPADLSSLGESLLAQSVFLQNVVFWKGEGYFALPSESKPLLHTWSLAVEEQFYLLYPLVLLLLFRAFSRRGIGGIITLTALASFGLGIVGMHYFPSASFYFLPTRAWELFAGAMIVFLPQFSGGTLLRESISTICVALILASGLVFSAATPFPGYAAALPVLATAGFLWINSNTSTFAARCLSWKPIVLVGLISYSLYLWHWPVLVFSRIWAPEPLGIGIRVLLAAAVLVMAAISWRWVEQPVRKLPFFRSPGRVAVLAGACLAFCAVAGFFLALTGGFPSRLPESMLAGIRASEERHFVNEHKPGDVTSGHLTIFGSRQNPPKVFLWGDSLGMALVAGLDSLLEEAGVAGRAATHSATPPLLDFEFHGVYSLGDQAPEFSREVIEYVHRESPTDVLLVGAWSGYLERTGDIKKMHDALEATVDALVASGARVWIVLEPPQHRDHIPKILARKILFGMDSSPYLATSHEHALSKKAVTSLLENFSTDKVKIVDIAPQFFSTNGESLIERDGEPLYRDHIHLTMRGAILAVAALENAGFPYRRGGSQHE
jgi:peptidoglycan/LPS O-acetylase OafA/YrhL